MKPVQTVTVGGVGAPQFKTIFPLSTPSNVQQIQVPGSRFHYVRLVTATTGSSTGHAGSPITNSSMTGRSQTPNSPSIQSGRERILGPNSAINIQNVYTTVYNYLFSFHSQAHGGQHNPSQDVCPHCPSTDNEAGETHATRTHYLLTD